MNASSLQWYRIDYTNAQHSPSCESIPPHQHQRPVDAILPFMLNHNTNGLPQKLNAGLMLANHQHPLNLLLSFVLRCSHFATSPTPEGSSANSCKAATRQTFLSAGFEGNLNCDCATDECIPKLIRSHLKHQHQVGKYHSVAPLTIVKRARLGLRK